MRKNRTKRRRTRRRRRMRGGFWPFTNNAAGESGNTGGWFSGWFGKKKEQPENVAGEPNPNMPIEDMPTESPTAAGDTPETPDTQVPNGQDGGKRRRRKKRKTKKKRGGGCGCASSLVGGRRKKRRRTRKKKKTKRRRRR